MKRIGAIALIALLVWLAASFPHVMLNPGKLVAGHQDLKNKCESCHKPFWGISSEKCISCHKPSEIGKDSIKGNNASAFFHGSLSTKECTSCHTDHKGINPTVSLSKFNHNLLSATDQTTCNSCHSRPLDNLHKQLSSSCNNCHNTDGWKSSIIFNHNMIQGVGKSNCISCHDKPKDNFHDSFDNNCLKCHGTEKWFPSTFDHSIYFRLDRNHNAKCNTCHSDNNFSIYTCYGCHEHSERKLRAEHNEEGIYNFSNCISCHRSGNEHEIKYNKMRIKNGEGGNRKKKDDDD